MPNLTRQLAVGSMMTFLRLCRPLDDKAKWALIVESKSRSDPEGQAKLLRVSPSRQFCVRFADLFVVLGCHLIDDAPTNEEHGESRRTFSRQTAADRFRH